MNQHNNYLLRFNQFESTIKTTWQELQTEKDFCDMTLACEDKQILTHKIIISSSSPLFRNILKQNSNQHPVIYLRGVKYKHLQNLINFLHQGEVNVAEEDLIDFLEVAKDLKIRGLSGESFNPKNEFSREIYQNIVEPSPKRKSPEEKLTNNVDNTGIINPTTILEKEDFGGNSFLIVEEKVNTTEDTKKDKSNGYFISVNGVRTFSCDMCDRQYTKSIRLRQHKESAHEGVKYPCDQCNVSPFNNVNILRRHKATIHEGVRYLCDQCDVPPFTDSSNFRQHRESVHEGRQYPCDQCDDSPSYSCRGLSQHKATVHKGIRYECDKCDYKGTQKSNLRKHMEKVHL